MIRSNIWALVTLVTLYVLVDAVVNWNGARQWAAARAELAREGETLDMKELTRVTADEGRNFCAIEPLRDLTVASDPRSPGGLRLAALLREALPSGGGSLKKPPSGEGPAFGTPADMRAWATFVSESKYAVLPAGSEHPEQDLLAAMDAAHPLLKQLAEAAPMRPDAAFVPPLPLSRPLFAVACPHFQAANQTGPALALRALAASAVGDHAAACQSIQAALRLAVALRREPFLIGTLSACVVHSTAENSLWNLLEKRQLTEAELQAVQESLAALNFHDALLTAMRSELVAEIDTVEYLQGAASEIPAFTSVLPTEGRESPPKSPLRYLWNLVPTGLFDENKTVLASLMLREAIRPLKEPALGPLLNRQSAFEQELKALQGPWHPHYFFARMLVPSIQRSVDRAAAEEALRLQGLTACALEHWYLQHHAYPAGLQDLVPALLPAVPADPIDGRPLRYRQTDDGRYMLWSIGLDQKDNEGRVNLSHLRLTTTSQPYRRSYEGDWVWQYTAVKR